MSSWYRSWRGIVGLLLVAAPVQGNATRARPLGLCPQNPHYLLFHGRPIVLIGSTEHYGAVLNPDFDFAQYLKTLQSEGMQVTRLFSGAYVEPEGAFHIDRNTLAPARGKLLCPWMRSQTPGYANGGNKFDLLRWDAAYFKRLRDFVADAGERGIVVEVVLFCPFYENSMWDLSPLNSRNNVNGIGDIARTDAYTLGNGKLLQIQDAMVRKFVEELKDADNIYYEICNEPYFGGVTSDWQDHIISTLTHAESELQAEPHLIAQNIANGSQRISHPNASTSIFNFHYASPPDAVGQNASLDKPIADDETGFKGTSDAAYRAEAWEFVLAGGGIFDHLDYSFTVKHERGDFQFPPTQPGSGGAQLRRGLASLSRFIGTFDLASIKPADGSIHNLPKGVSAHVLASPGKQYAIYFRGGRQISPVVTLPPGTYLLDWIRCFDGLTIKKEDVTVGGETVQLTSPQYDGEVALSIKRSSNQ